MIGETVHHYRVEALLGTGGMGEVYRAEDLRLGRPVALKFLSPELAGEPQWRERLAREARGLYEVHGNVWEWVGDWYGPYSGDTTDPTGSAMGSARVGRGGSWYSDARASRSASRNRGAPDRPNDAVGFRLVRAAP